MLSFFAPETVAFDLVPPLAYTGVAAYRKQWEKLFASYQGLIEYEIRDLSIITESQLAFSHSINRISGMLLSGHKTGFWLRMTACWRRIDGQGSSGTSTSRCLWIRRKVSQCLTSSGNGCSASELATVASRDLWVSAL